MKIVARSGLAKAGLVLASLLMAGGVAEFGLRWLETARPPTFPPGLFRFEGPYGYRLAPNFRGEMAASKGLPAVPVHTDGLGLRMNAGGTLATARARRLLVLGDSQTFGPWVKAEEAYPAVLERLLNGQNQERSWAVMNAGVPGYGTREEIALYRAHAQDFDASVVLVGVYLGNDIADNSRDVLKHSRAVPLPLKNHLRRLRTYRLVADAYNSVLVAGGWRAEGYYSGGGLLEIPAQPWVDTGLRRTSALLQELASLVSSNGARPVLVLLPFSLQVLPQKRKGWSPERVEFPQRELMKVCAASRLPCIDALPALRSRADEGRDVFYAEDSYNHLNPEGHAVIAATILRELSAELK